MIFGITNSIFYIVENNEIVLYDSPNNRIAFCLEYGLAGMVVKEMKPYIIHDIRSNNVYNKLVDLTSILPIYALPLITKNTKEVIGVIEIVLKN